VFFERAIVWGKRVEPKKETEKKSLKREISLCLESVKAIEPNSKTSGISEA